MSDDTTAEDIKADDTKTEENKIMGTRIRDRRLYLRRKNHGTYTQEYVAARLGMSRVGYAHYEAGRNAISHSDLTRLAAILDAPVNYFYGLAEEEQVEQSHSIRAYNGLPTWGKRLVDAQIEAVQAMLNADDASEDLHGKVIGSKRAE